MKRRNLIQRLTMPLPELEAYYRERRQEQFEQNDSFHGVELRKRLHQPNHGRKLLPGSD